MLIIPGEWATIICSDYSCSRDFYDMENAADILGIPTRRAENLWLLTDCRCHPLLSLRVVWFSAMNKADLSSIHFFHHPNNTDSNDSSLKTGDAANTTFPGKWYWKIAIVCIIPSNDAYMPHVYHVFMGKTSRELGLASRPRGRKSSNALRCGGDPQGLVDHMYIIDLKYDMI